MTFLLSAADAMSTRPVTRFLNGGDTALVVEFGGSIDRRISALVLALAHRLETEAIPGIVELVPTFRSLMVHYDPLLLSHAELKRRLSPLLDGLEARKNSGRRWRIPACFDVSVGLDLPDVASRTGLTAAQVVERLSSAPLHVYMIGFLPGFPYLGDLPKELELPRRETPRIKLPAGSIAVAMTLAAIYPVESPGGWHIVGRTPAPLWDLNRDPPALLAAGDQVVFQTISVSEYESLSADAAAGILRMTPENVLLQEQPDRFPRA
jgi:KipI family sensor histidine kinase inhibitor